MSTVVSAIAPVFLVAAAAYGFRRRLHLDIRTLSSLNIYLLTPALVFASLSERALEWAVLGRYTLATVLLTGVLWGLLESVARLRGMEPGRRGAFLMSMFVNLGNFGLPICTFAFGQEGLFYAIAVMVCGMFFQNSLGIYFAQRSRYSVLHALAQVLRFPVLYAFAAGMVFGHMGWSLPEALARAVGLVGSAAIPLQLIILGAALAETRLDTGVDVGLAVGIRLILGPLAAALAAWAAGLEGLASSVFILQLSGPVAVGMAVFGVQFDVQPRFLASVVAWTFLGSMISVAAVLYVLL